MNIVEIVVLLAVALIVVGPEGLPPLLQTAGKILRELRLASNNVMRELTEELEQPRQAMRELNPFNEPTEQNPANTPGEKVVANAGAAAANGDSRTATKTGEPPRAA